MLWSKAKHYLLTDSQTTVYNSCFFNFYYTNFRKDIKVIEFKVNQHEMCFYNEIKYVNQQTVTWHVDDLKSSHLDLELNDKFVEWCEVTYESDNLGHVKVVRGKVHNYLDIIVKFTQNCAFNIDMKYFIEGILEEFPYTIKAK